jgi:TadE-like protein
MSGTHAHGAQPHRLGSACRPWTDAHGPQPRRLGSACRPSRARGEDGQATVELVAILPFVAALLAAIWQLALAGHASSAASTAARAAARAHAVGTDPRSAARDHLPRALENGLRVRTAAAGEVRVEVRIPGLPGLPSPGHTRATARFEPQ